VSERKKVGSTMEWIIVHQVKRDCLVVGDQYRY
jgi:hypothetical protein